MTNESKWVLDALEELAFTAVKDGEYWRATYTKEDKESLILLEMWMKKKGFETYYDEVGNLFGRIKGNSDEIVLTGSHRDTVKNGGKYDGTLGVLSGIEVLSTLKKEYGKPEKTMEVVAMCEEEASRFLAGYVGSRAITGTLTEENLKEKDENGIMLKTAITESDYYRGKLPEGKKNINQFLELHIEQGAVLENSNMKIGIVTSIVGLIIGTVTFVGEQNHAGTTPMSLRKDPMPVTAKFITKLNEWAEQYCDKLTCTVGNIKVEPGQYNIIADRVTMTFDIRSSNNELLVEAEEYLLALANQLSGIVKVEVEVACFDRPIYMSSKGIETMEHIAKSGGYEYLVMSSGAGHDAQIIAEYCDTNMIFVPSVKGISHSPEEFTKTEDIEIGLKFMKEYLKEVGW
ncbi:MAG: M20 family metallo-hydrolase [Peptostreptococcaceae bacterium]|nr:M20 family metallo-hydrolase [Peptostreptococcaceae bacterium]